MMTEAVSLRQGNNLSLTDSHESVLDNSDSNCYSYHIYIFQ